MEKRIKKFWIAGFFLPAINATVFSLLKHRTKEVKTNMYFKFKRGVYIKAGFLVKISLALLTYLLRLAGARID